MNKTCASFQLSNLPNSGEIVETKVDKVPIGQARLRQRRRLSGDCNSPSEVQIQIQGGLANRPSSHRIPIRRNCTNWHLHPYVLMTPSVAFLHEGEVYLRGEPILLQEWPEGDSLQGEGVSGYYHRLSKLATSSVRLGETHR